MKRNSDNTRPGWQMMIAVAAVAALFPAGSTPSAQQAFMHLNPLVEKLAQGKTVFGVSTGDLSIDNARALARADIDFVRLEMEHGPMDFSALRNFLIGTIDKAQIMRKGNLQPNVAVISRFGPYGREQVHWVSKQALDMGLMGVAFNTIATKEQALSAVQSMRFPQKRGAKYPQPVGLRGHAPGNAVWFWGITGEEYDERADLWPLNPQGDLLAIMMIESVEAVKNIDAIAQVPGVGVLWPGAAGDLSMSMGVPQRSPEVEVALQRILKSCKTHNVVCGINAGARDIEKRVKEGWRYLEIGGGGGLGSAAEAALRAGRAVAK